MNALRVFSEGSKCSVVIEVEGKFLRRNGVVKNKIQHLKGCWCVELAHPCKGEPSFVRAFEKHFEIIEPMTDYENLINAFDELK
jgi:hypothetical protein